MEKVNYLAVSMGYPGSGKSALLGEHVGMHAAKGAYCFVMDPDQQFADIMPCYASPDAYKLAQRDRARAGEPIEKVASIATGDEALLSQFIFDFADLHPGAYVFIGYDEAVLLSKSSSNYISPEMENLLARRRHKGIAAEILCQDIGQLHARWQRLATDLYCFQLVDPDRSKHVSKRFGIPLGLFLAHNNALRERYDYLHMRPRKLI